MGILETIQQDWIFYLLNMLAFIIVVTVTWLYSQSKHAEAIAKLQVQLQQLQLQQNDKLFALEDEYQKKKERLRLIMKDMENQLRNQDVDMLTSRRNELSNVFIMEYATTMHQYARLADQFYELHPPKHRAFVRNYIFPFLDISRKVLAAINTPKIMQTIGTKSLVKYSYKDFDFAFDMIRKHGTMDLRREMLVYLKELEFKKADLD